MYRSQTFVNHYVPKNPFYNMSGLAGSKVAIYVGCAGSGWSINVASTHGTPYGLTNSVEDFAETFAVAYALTVNQSSFPYNSFDDPWRLNEMNAMINGTIR